MTRVPLAALGAAALVLCLVALTAPVAAQSVDTQLSYQGGVVYDDDLVPGRGTNTPFLAEETAGVGRVPGVSGEQAGAYEYRGRRPRRQPSANLIGPDGTLRD